VFSQGSQSQPGPLADQEFFASEDFLKDFLVFVNNKFQNTGMPFKSRTKALATHSRY